MKYLSLFSGIEAASVAWEPLGWEPVAFSEIEPFPCEVLKYHWPWVTNLGDVTKITEKTIKALGQFDLIIFGSPCQDLSVAGNREGSMEKGVDCSSPPPTLSNGQSNTAAVDSPSGKTYPEPLRLTMDKTFLKFCSDLLVHGTTYQKPAGKMPVLQSASKGLSSGACLTLNTSESPNVVAESSLWQILETGQVEDRYYLSPRACQGS